MAFGRLITVFRSQPLLLSLSFDSGPEPLGALTNLLQYCFKISQFFRARIGKDPFNLGSVFAKNRCDQFFAFCCERYDADAAVFRTLDPAYQASIQEAVDGHADRAGRKVHLWADRIHRQRSFVQEGLKYAEVGIIDSRLLESGIEIFRGRLEVLPQYQPTVNRVSRVLVHDETILTLCVTNVHKNASISIDFASIDTVRERHKDIAAMVAFLFSDDAAYINGQTILVDGGASLT